MTNSAVEYTYRAGEKIHLTKKQDQFVARGLPDDLGHLNSRGLEQVSSRSSRITVHVDDLDEMMEEVRQGGVAHHAYEIADSNQEFLITDRVFVTFHNALTPAEVQAFADRYALVQLETYSQRDYLFQLTDKTGMNPIKLVVKLTEEESQVEIADHDLNHRMSKYVLDLPTDPDYARQWHLHTHFNNQEFDQRSSSRCEHAWEMLGNFGSSDVVIAVTDDGCKMTHHDFGDLDSTHKKFAGWGYFEGDTLIRQGDAGADPNKMYELPHNHGTACAGVAAADVNAQLTVGAAPGCRLLPIKWESNNQGSLWIGDSRFLTALNSIADEVDVISNSWGNSPTKMWGDIVKRRIAQLAKNGGRRKRGIVFLWAAGNENCPINYTANQDVPHTNGWREIQKDQWRWVGVDTARRFSHNSVGIPGVMHVAAVSSMAQRSHYSNYGPGISICAPSNNVHTYYRLQAPQVSGLGITTTKGDNPDSIRNDFGGTSSATPLVAGIAALVISANPNLTATEVVSILKRTASKNMNFNGYAQTPPNPNGRPDPRINDPDTSWDVSPVAPYDNGQFINTKTADGTANGANDPDGTWSPWFGYGRVDAAAAVAEAKWRGQNRVVWVGKMNYSSYAQNQDLVFILPQGIANGNPGIAAWRWTKDAAGNVNKPTLVYGKIVNSNLTDSTVDFEFGRSESYYWFSVQINITTGAVTRFTMKNPREQECGGGSSLQLTNYSLADLLLDGVTDNIKPREQDLQNLVGGVWVGKMNYSTYAQNQDLVFILPRGIADGNPGIAAWRWTKDAAGNVNKPTLVYGKIVNSNPTDSTVDFEFGRSESYYWFSVQINITTGAVTRFTMKNPREQECGGGSSLQLTDYSLTDLLLEGINGHPSK